MRTGILLTLLLGTSVFAQTPATPTAAAPPTPPPQNIVVTLLGTSGPSMAADRPESGTLVQAGGETLLIDCGRGVPEQLIKAGVRGVSKVFLTHLHSDHVQGLPVLWMGGWNGRGGKLSIWGPGVGPDQPTGTVGMAQALTTAFATNTHIRRDMVEKWSGDNIILDAHDIDEGVVYESNGVKVTAFRVAHEPVSPAFGYRVDYAGHSVVVSGDTRPSDNLVKFSKGVDVLIHEIFGGGAGPAGRGAAAGAAAQAGDGTQAAAGRQGRGGRAGRPGGAGDGAAAGGRAAGGGPGTGAVAAYHSSAEDVAGIFKRVAPKMAVYSHMAGNVGDPTDRTRAAGYTGPLTVGKDLMVITIGDAVSIK